MRKVENLEGLGLHKVTYRSTGRRLVYTNKTNHVRTNFHSKLRSNIDKRLQVLSIR